ARHRGVHHRRRHRHLLHRTEQDRQHLAGRGLRRPCLGHLQHRPPGWPVRRHRDPRRSGRPRGLTHRLHRRDRPDHLLRRRDRRHRAAAPHSRARMTHKNAPLTPEGRKRLIERCRTRPIAHVAAEMGISRATASKWVNRYKQFGELGLIDRSSAPVRQPTATPGETVARIESMRREKKWSASRIAFELHADGVAGSRRTVTRHLAQPGLNRRRFIDPNGETHREAKTITATHPRHMVHLDVKKVGRIPDGGGWRAHGKGSEHAKAVARTKARGTRTGYAYLHSAIDGHTRLAYTESLENEQGPTAVAF